MTDSRFLGSGISIKTMGITAISNPQDWEREVVNSAVPVFVDFWAEWCGPCRMVSPVVDELATIYDGRVKFVKVNVDEASELASRYQVFSIPTLVILKGGNVAAQQVGAASKESYIRMIDRTL